MKTFLFSICFLCLLPAAFVGAGELPDSWRVVSDYTRASDGQRSSVVWEYHKTDLDSGSLITARDANGTIPARLEMELDEYDRLIKARTVYTIRGKDRVIEQTFDPNTPAIFPDSLIPADRLNIPEHTAGRSNKKFSLRRKAGNHAFASCYTLSRQQLSPDQAAEQKMISPETAARFSGEELTLISVHEVKNGEENLVLQRLSAESHPLWLYQSLGLRESRFLFK